MAFKFVALMALVAAANAGLIPAGPISYAQPASLTYPAVPITKAVVAKTVDADYDPHPQYSYAYDVHDTLTGDAKSQQETRDGDVVQGSYSLLEADGTKRTVDYTADPVNGFNAVVRKEPAGVAVKAVAAAPIAHAPLAYAASAPVLAAPVAKVATPLTYAPAAKLAVAHAAPYTAAYASPYAAPYAAPYAVAPAQYAVAHSAPALAYSAHPAPLAYAAHPAPLAYAAHPAPIGKIAAAPALAYGAHYL